jgi:hypothetical protein
MKIDKENIMNLADAYAAEVANTPQMPTPLERKLAVVKIGAARAALEAALEQPEQQAEPVAWMRPSEEGYDSAFRDHHTIVTCAGNPWTGWIPLYTAPPQRPWQGLTDEDRFEIAAAQYGWEDLLIAAEAKLKELNHDTARTQMG